MLRKHETAVLVTPIARTLPNIGQADWIGIDAGYKKILEMKKDCLFAIGDFDSAKLDSNLPFPVFRHPVEKDETDTELALAAVSKMGYSRVILWGALGGRLDHTLANLRCIVWMYPDTICMDENHQVTVLKPGCHSLAAHYRHVSFFAMEPSVITLEGFDYPLFKRAIDQRDFYTCSNSISGAKAEIIIESGRVLCVQTNIA